MKNKHEVCGNFFVVITTQFATKKQVKDLTHMFCL